MKTYPNDPYPFEAPGLMSWHTLESLLVGVAFTGTVLLAAAFWRPADAPAAPTHATRATAGAARPRARRAAALVPASERFRRNEVAAARGEVN